MSKNPIADRIAEEKQKDLIRLHERYKELWSMLDETSLTKSEKNKISDLIEGIVYTVERQTLQREVEEINARLSGLYWACRPSNQDPYYRHDYRKQAKVNA